MNDHVMCAPLAAAAERAIDYGWLESWGELAEITLGRRDTSQLKRLLGLQPMSEGGTRRTLDYDRAVQIALALPNVDPVDVGV